MGSRLIYLFFLSQFLVISALAGDDAKDGAVDIVYTTSGAVVRGRIIDDIPGDKVVMIMAADGSRVEIPYKKVFRITDEAGLEGVQEYFQNWSKRPSVWSRSFVENRAGAMKTDFLMIDVMAGYKACKFFDAGIGIGILLGKDSAVPLFASFRPTMPGRIWAPHLFIDIGYAFGAAHSMDMFDFFFNWGLGIVRRIGEKHDFVIQAGVYASGLYPEWRYERYFGFKIGIRMPFRTR